MKTINIEKALGHLPVVHVNNTEGVELSSDRQPFNLLHHVPDGLIIVLFNGYTSKPEVINSCEIVDCGFNAEVDCWFRITGISDGWRYPHNQDVAVSIEPDLYYSLYKSDECWYVDNPRDLDYIEENDIGDAIDIYCGEAKTTVISDFLNDISEMIADNIYERMGEDPDTEKFNCPILGVELNKKVGECVNEFYAEKGVELGFREVDNVVKQQYRIISIEPVELVLIEDDS